MRSTLIRPMPAAARRIAVEHVMGTVVSIDVRDDDVPKTEIDAALEWLREVDRRFSPFKADSEVSRLGRGELTIDECHADVATVLDLCEQLRERSGGAFNALRGRADGRLDPSGVVKGWAVERAADILLAAGAGNFAINAGGDAIVRGEPEPGRRWKIGIRHPDRLDAVAAVIEASDIAVATSGSYERGHHIIDARSGRPSRGLVSLTVAGPSMTMADAYATAGFAMGIAGIDWVRQQPGYSVYGITADRIVRYDERFACMLVKGEDDANDRGTDDSAA